MRRSVASGQSERDHERGDLAAISVAVSRATEGRRLRGGASSSPSATVRFALPVANSRSCRHCAGFKPERHGRLRRAVETSESCGATGGATWPQFLKQCRAQMSGGSSASIAPAPVPAPAPPPPASAPAQNGSLFPWSQPTAPAAAPANYGAPAPTGASASAQQPQYRCPGATVVWVNEKSHIYHFPGTHDYGNTKRGAYMCEADAQAAGNRAAKNERHP